MMKLNIQIGCQTFTWEMLGDGWTGSLEDLVETISQAGYSGIEITDTMVGHFANNNTGFAKILANAGLDLISFAFGSSSGFCEPDALASDLEMTKTWVDFAAAFPSALVSLGSATIMSEGNRAEKFDAAAEVYNRATEIGHDAGVTVAIHPSSHTNTLLSSREDYDEIFKRLDPGVGWVPDTGHILRGNQNMIDTMSTYRARIRYVHLKDVDASGSWQMLGDGICDMTAVIETALSAPDFNGWLVIEEESKDAASNPNAAVARNRETMRSLGY